MFAAEPEQRLAPARRTGPVPVPSLRQAGRTSTGLDRPVHDDDLPSLHRFASHLERDLDTVVAGLTLPWDSGVVERHVNWIKMLKRQVFGRASFALLRRRVLRYP
jgi:transposase